LENIMTELNFADIKPEVEHFVREMVDKSSLDLRVEVLQPEPDNIQIQFKGFDLPLLLGHNAELLDAFQYIARRAFAKAVADGLPTVIGNRDHKNWN
jgi:predicted RNA-binding protein Jag